MTMSDAETLRDDNRRQFDLIRALRAEVARLRERTKRLDDEAAAYASALGKGCKRIATLEAALREISDMGMEPDGSMYGWRDYVRVARAALEASEPDHICDSGACGLDPCEEMPVHREPARVVVHDMPTYPLDFDEEADADAK